MFFNTPQQPTFLRATMAFGPTSGGPPFNQFHTKLHSHCNNGYINSPFVPIITGISEIGWIFMILCCLKRWELFLTITTRCIAYFKFFFSVRGWGIISWPILNLLPYFLHHNFTCYVLQATKHFNGWLVTFGSVWMTAPEVGSTPLSLRKMVGCAALMSRKMWTKPFN